MRERKKERENERKKEEKKERKKKAPKPYEFFTTLVALWYLYEKDNIPPLML